MTLRLSTGARHGLLHSLGFGGMLNRGSIEIRSGSQPVSADALATGNLLGIATEGGLPLTKETAATGTIVITGSTGIINTVTVGTFNIIPDGLVLFNTSTAQTAADLATAINRNGIFSASVSASTVTIKPRPGAGVAFNGLVLASTGTCTATYGGGFVSGGVAPINGLYLADPASGVIGKPVGRVWNFNGIANGTAGWFRYVASEADAGALITAAPWLVRMDGTIAVSGGDMGLTNISVAIGAPNTIDRFNMTQPAQ